MEETKSSNLIKVKQTQAGTSSPHRLYPPKERKLSVSLLLQWCIFSFEAAALNRQ